MISLVCLSQLCCLAEYLTRSDFLVVPQSAQFINPSAVTYDPQHQQLIVVGEAVGQVIDSFKLSDHTARVLFLDASASHASSWPVAFEQALVCYHHQRQAVIVDWYRVHQHCQNPALWHWNINGPVHCR